MVAVREAHDLECRKATEVLLFLLSDTDREYKKDKLFAVPVAYALKGKSLRVSTARKMVSDVRNFLHQHDIKVIVEAYDGQWAGLVFCDHNDKPLTLFELQRDCWLKFSKMSKKKLVTFIESISRNTQENLDAWSHKTFTLPESLQIGNIRTELAWHDDTSLNEQHMVECKTYLTVKSFCNEFNCEGGIGLVTFPQVDSRQDLWEVCICDSNLLHILGVKEFSSHSIHYEEENLGLDDDHSQHLHDLEHDLVAVEMHDTDPNFTPGKKNFTSRDSEHIKSLLLTTHRSISTEIIFLLLCGKRQEKWTSLSVEDLVGNILSSAANIFKELTSYEIDGILRIIQRHSCGTCPLIIPSKMKKLAKSNFLAFILGNYCRYFPPTRKVNTLETLANLCRKEVLCSVPDNVLRAGLALWTFRYNLQDWINNSPVPITVELPMDPFEFDVFSYPDICEGRSQVESRLIDPSHCLTNLRIHATQKGFFGCDHKAFLRVSAADNNVLNRALLVEPLPDKQSVAFALKIFSSDVEQVMQNNADMKEAELVRNIRQWYEACNDRGIQLTERLCRFVTMHNYMLSFYKPKEFPMNTTHVCGLPSTTFQAVLHNILTRLQLYHLSSKKTYNQRVVSTLAVETMFSILTTLSRTTSGIPLAAKIPCYISKITQFASTQCNPDKYVHMLFLIILGPYLKFMLSSHKVFMNF